MTGSPFSNVLGHDPDDSTYRRVESTDTTDTTAFSAGRPADDASESSLGVEVSGSGVTHESGQDETPGDQSSGARTP